MAGVAFCVTRGSRPGSDGRRTALEMEMPRRGDRLVVTLECRDCGSRGYVSTKNRRNTPDRLDLRKYCRACRAHKAHRETR